MTVAAIAAVCPCAIGTPITHTVVYSAPRIDGAMQLRAARLVVDGKEFSEVRLREKANRLFKVFHPQAPADRVELSETQDSAGWTKV